MNERAEVERPDAGFTLVEMLVSMALFAVLGTVLLSFALGSSRVADDVTRSSTITGEARLAVERMTRELRQASEIYAATVTGGQVTSLTIGVDFNATPGIQDDANDPERLTYTWDEAREELTLSGGGSTVQVLAGGVVDADIRLRSSAWIYDGVPLPSATASNAPDGTTTWQEVDASTIGDKDGQLDAAELALVDLVSIELVVRDGASERRFTVQADMRNRGVTS